VNVTLTFVPPGGGEADYCLDFELPSIPQPGDHISIMRPSADGTADFIVKRTWWNLSADNDGGNSQLNSITVECEFAEGLTSSTQHKQSVDAYERQKGKRLSFDSSTY